MFTVKNNGVFCSKSHIYFFFTILKYANIHHASKQDLFAVFKQKKIKDIIWLQLVFILCHWFCDTKIHQTLEQSINFNWIQN